MSTSATHPPEADYAVIFARSGEVIARLVCPEVRVAVHRPGRQVGVEPALLRETRGETVWGPDRTTVMVFTPYFHRDAERLPYADRFEPDIWLDGRAADNPALVPFSGGPGACPGRNVVLFTTSMLLANLVRDHDIQLLGSALTPDELPLTLDNFGLRFLLHRRAS